VRDYRVTTVEVVWDFKLTGLKVRTGNRTGSVDSASKRSLLFFGRQ